MSAQGDVSRDPAVHRIIAAQRKVADDAVKEHDEFVNACLEIIPPSYDGDEAGEAIVLRFLKDMSDLAGILARLTSDYR